MNLHLLQYKYLRKYNHLSHPNERRNQTKSIARMDLLIKLRRRKEKIENERKEEGVRERNIYIYIYIYT